MSALVELRGLKKHYPVSGGLLGGLSLVDKAARQREGALEGWVGPLDEQHLQATRKPQGHHISGQGGAGIFF